MAINYGAAFGSNLSNSDELISNINRISGAPPTAPTLATNPSMYSMTAAQVGGNFGNAYQSALGSYPAFPSGNTSGMSDLESLYSQVPAAYDVSGTIGAMDTARKAALLTGQQASNTAASKYLSEQAPGQYSGSSANVLRAQALLPFMTQDTQEAQSEGQYADTAKQQAIATAANIANQLGNLQNNYTSTLANYNSQKAANALGYANDQTGLQVQASQNLANNALGLYQTQAQLAENARQANLSAALSVNQQQTQAAETSTAQQLQAAQAVMANKGPTGSWTTSPTGQITSGQSAYNAYQNYMAQRGSAAATLAALAAK